LTYAHTPLPTSTEAKRALKEYLLQNEANKAIKEEAKKAAWEEDLHYKAAWEAVLDKQERERTDRCVGEGVGGSRWGGWVHDMVGCFVCVELNSTNGSSVLVGNMWSIPQESVV
jgi:hypothetical protein